MTAVFTRRLRLFILLFLAEGLETSASLALSFRFFPPFPGLSLVPGIRSPPLPFQHLPPTNPQGRVGDGALRLPGKDRCARGRSPPVTVTTLPSAIHSPRARTWVAPHPPAWHWHVGGLLRVSVYLPYGSPAPTLDLQECISSSEQASDFPHSLVSSITALRETPPSPPAVRSSRQRRVPATLSFLGFSSAKSPDFHSRFYQMCNILSTACRRPHREETSACIFAHNPELQLGFLKKSSCPLPSFETFALSIKHEAMNIKHEG